MSLCLVVAQVPPPLPADDQAALAQAVAVPYPALATAADEATVRVLATNLPLLRSLFGVTRPLAECQWFGVEPIAAGVFALVTPDIWRLADSFGWVRMAVVAGGDACAAGGRNHRHSH